MAHTEKAWRRLFIVAAILVLVVGLTYFLFPAILCRLGEFLVFDESPPPSDAVVVLSTGMEYYPRLVESANLFKQGIVDTIVINGNRKTSVLRSLETRGYEACCPWYENALRILSVLGVPRDRVICISAEDAYDTVTEAESVGTALLQQGMTQIILTTSKSHTRRAHHIWSKRFEERLSIYSVSAKTDPYDPHGWWKQGRQVRWVLAEYGAWLYYGWKRLKQS